MEMRPRPRRRAPDQPSFSSTLLDAICDSMDGGGDPAGGPRTAARMVPPKKKQDAAVSYYYYKPALAASHRARAAPSAATAEHGGSASSPTGDCPARGYFSSSEVEYSLRRLRPIRTSGDGAGLREKKQQQRAHQSAAEKATKKPAAASARRPASPGARLASLLNSIFSGKRPSSSHRTAAAPPDQERACSTARSSYARRPCLAKTPPCTARARASRSRTVRFLDIDGEVAVAAAAAGCRRIPVVEVEEVLLRPVDVGAHTEAGEQSSDGSSDLFELDDLAAIDPARCFVRRGGAYADELPVYGTTGVHRGIGQRRPYEYALGRNCSRVV